MAGYTEPLKQHLREAGCKFERQGKDDHEIWYSPSQELNSLLIEISRHTANAVLKQAGLPKKF